MKSTTLGAFLRQERKRHGIPRPLLAQQTGIEEDTLAAFEFSRKIPSAPELRVLARQLDVDETQLLVRARYIQPEP